MTKRAASHLGRVVVPLIALVALSHGCAGPTGGPAGPSETDLGLIPPTPAPQVYDPEVERTITADGARGGIRASVQGGTEGGPVLIVLPGAGLGAESVRPFVGLAAGDVAIVRFDPAGLGDNSALPVAASLEAWATDIEAVAAALGPSALHLLGLEEGAILALSYGLDHPVASVTLVDPAAPTSEERVAASAARDRAAARRGAVPAWPDGESSCADAYAARAPLSTPVPCAAAVRRATERAIAGVDWSLELTMSRVPVAIFDLNRPGSRDAAASLADALGNTVEKRAEVAGCATGLDAEGCQNALLRAVDPWLTGRVRWVDAR